MSRQPIYKDGIRVSIRMNGDTKAKLEIASKKTGQTVTGIINEAMTEKLEKFKDEGMIINTVERIGEMERLTMLAEDGKKHDTKIIAFGFNFNCCITNSLITVVFPVPGGPCSKYISLEHNACSIISFLFSSKNSFLKLNSFRV